MKIFDGGLIIVLVFIAIVVAASVGKAMIEDEDTMDNLRQATRSFFQVHNN